MMDDVTVRYYWSGDDGEEVLLDLLEGVYERLPVEPTDSYEDVAKCVEWNYKPKD